MPPESAPSPTNSEPAPGTVTPPVAPDPAVTPPATPALPPALPNEFADSMPALDPEPPLSTTPTGMSPPATPKRSWPLMATALVAAVVLTIGGYWLGARSHSEPSEEQTESTHVATTVTLPKDATVTAECVDGRGKQYIVPKDIPMGPVYDVYQGKVIAIEYLVGQAELAKQSSLFADLALPAATYDHLTLMPMDPHAGENEAHFHTIAYLISATESAKIKCANPSSDMNNMHM